MTIAVIRTGGKQYKVKAGDRIKVEKINGNAGDIVNFDSLLVADEKGSLELGKPLLEKKVEAKILKQGKEKKVSVVKFKSKVRYRRNVGHRQPFTEVEILKV